MHDSCVPEASTPSRRICSPDAFTRWSPTICTLTAEGGTETDEGDVVGGDVVEGDAVEGGVAGVLTASLLLVECRLETSHKIPISNNTTSPDIR